MGRTGLHLISYPRPGCTEFPQVVEAIAGYWQKIGLRPKIRMTEWATWRNAWGGRKTQNTVHGFESSTSPEVGAAHSRKVWVKLSAPYRSSLETAAAAAPMLLKHFGPERLVWGSDWPFTNFEKTTRYPEMRTLLDKWVPDAQQRQMILAETPAKLYRF